MQYRKTQMQMQHSLSPGGVTSLIKSSNGGRKREVYRHPEEGDKYTIIHRPLKCKTFFLARHNAKITKRMQILPSLCCHPSFMIVPSPSRGWLVHSSARSAEAVSCHRRKTCVKRYDAVPRWLREDNLDNGKCGCVCRVKYATVGASEVGW